ncbi:hypothetical protein BIW11_13148 [Tropilaelaps mercedesae]|uniref:Uncharacterized protein n=1 Tax=Tropilaelaps mercedesae TaxID=418985 RepID=A0A1V9X3T1_9ACAR|nr:hypothetical protein BIW11_13148 [Tropilaelaps mercedesae]
MALEEGGGAIPPYMPMQGVPDRAVPPLGMKQCPSIIPGMNEATPKKNNSCKTQ